MNCPHCQAELPSDYIAESCPSCGRHLSTQAEAKPPELPIQSKSIYWLVFWLAFFGSPILGLLAASARLGGGILFLAIPGAIIAGFSLAKVYTKTPATFVAVGILFTVGVLVIYLGILFVGCLVMLKHSSGI